MFQFAIQAGIDRANQSVPTTSRLIQCWKVLAAQFSYPSGELTIDGRLRRHAITEIHLACVKSLYDDQSPCSGNGVCLQPPDKSNHLLRPPQNLLLQQLSQVIRLNTHLLYKMSYYDPFSDQGGG